MYRLPESAALSSYPNICNPSLSEVCLISKPPCICVSSCKSIKVVAVNFNVLPSALIEPPGQLTDLLLDSQTVPAKVAFCELSNARAEVSFVPKCKVVFSLFQI